MRYLKGCGLALIVSLALTAGFGAGSASATSLCKANETPCGSTNDIAAGTKIHFSTKGLTVEIIGPAGCSGASFDAVAAKTGGSSGTLENWRFGPCECGFKMLKPGTYLVAWTPGTMDGTMKIQNLEFESIGCGRCVYTGGFELTLKGGSPATMKMEGQKLLLKEASGICRIESEWRANWEVTSPNPLYVSE